MTVSAPGQSAVRTAEVGTTVIVEGSKVALLTGINDTVSTGPPLAVGTAGTTLSVRVVLTLVTNLTNPGFKAAITATAVLIGGELIPKTSKGWVGSSFLDKDCNVSLVATLVLVEECELSVVLDTVQSVLGWGVILHTLQIENATFMRNHTCVF